MYIKLKNYLEKQVLYCVFIGNYSYFFLLSGVKNSYFFLLLAENSYFFLLFWPLLPLDALQLLYLNQLTGPWVGPRSRDHPTNERVMWPLSRWVGRQSGDHSSNEWGHSHMTTQPIDIFIYFIVKLWETWVGAPTTRQSRVYWAAPATTLRTLSASRLRTTCNRKWRYPRPRRTSDSSATTGSTRSSSPWIPSMGGSTGYCYYYYYFNFFFIYII